MSASADLPEVSNATAPTAAELQASSPGALWVDTETLSPSIVALFKLQVQWFHRVTGIPAPELITGACPDVDAFCVRGGEPRPGATASAGTPWFVVVRPGALDVVTAQQVLRHEYVHLWLWPYEGTDGQGHFSDGHLMAPDIAVPHCHGLSAEELGAICDHRNCVAPRAECD